MTWLKHHGSIFMISCFALHNSYVDCLNFAASLSLDLQRRGARFFQPPCINHFFPHSHHCHPSFHRLQCGHVRGGGILATMGLQTVHIFLCVAIDTCRLRITGHSIQGSCMFLMLKIKQKVLQFIFS